nr:FAD-dependent monooxygenase [Jannaschia sp. S6380]
MIAGAGPAGLAAACVLGAEGHRVLLVDPAAPVTGEDAPDADLRTTALLQPARDLLAGAGAWDGLSPYGTALWTMRIVDASAAPPVTRDFRAQDISDAPFGWNFPNWLLRRELLARAAALDTVETAFGASVRSIFAREAGIRATLSDGRRVAARLVLASDGRDSPLRRMAGIGTRRTEYGQTAIVFAVRHAIPHDDISTEIHLSGGPFTLVPIADDAGGHRSAVVWMDDARRQAERMALDDGPFLIEAQARSADVMGPLELASRRAAWPITSVLAERWTGQRLALMGEAAHAMPPIGAQGLNTSLKDVAALRDLCRAEDIGSAEMLAAYERGRRADVAIRMAGVDLLNRTSIAGLGAVQAARAFGIAALHDVPPLRRAVMRLGLGAVVRPE